MSRPRFLIAALVLAFVCGTAGAQFVCDFFVKVPSHAAPAGGQASVARDRIMPREVITQSDARLTSQRAQVVPQIVRGQPAAARTAE